jgi:hypothetical protein
MSVWSVNWKLETQKLITYTLLYTHKRGACEMVRSDGAEARKQRIQDIIRTVLSKLNQGEHVVLSSIIAEIQYEYGLTQKTANEYLDIGEKLQRYNIDRLNDTIRKINES